MTVQTAEKIMSFKTAEKGDKPDFIVRARQERNSKLFQTIGAAWRRQDRNGSELISVKLNSVPISFDGSFILVAPLANEEDAA
jgi:uncharacterized protein (DUF736 family)